MTADRPTPARLTVFLDDAPVRFTPDGKVSVLDAIRALFGSDRPERVWRRVRRRHPEVDRHWQSAVFRARKGPVPVADGSGWTRIQAALMDHYLREAAAEAPA